MLSFAVFKTCFHTAALLLLPNDHKRGTASIRSWAGCLMKCKKRRGSVRSHLPALLHAPGDSRSHGTRWLRVPTVDLGKSNGLPQRPASFVPCFDFPVHLTRKLLQTPCRRSGCREAGSGAASIEPALYCNYWQAKQTFHFPVISYSLRRQVNLARHALSAQQALLLYGILP